MRAAINKSYLIVKENLAIIKQRFIISFELSHIILNLSAIACKPSCR